MSGGVDECDDDGDGDDICVEVNPPSRERVKHGKMPNGPFSPKYAPSPSTKYAPGGAGLHYTVNILCLETMSPTPYW